MKKILTRRHILTGLGVTGVVAGAGYGWTRMPRATKLLQAGEWLNYRAQRLIAGDALAREFSVSDISPQFPTNGNTDCEDPEYQRHAAEGFANWHLEVGGLVERPGPISLDQLRAMPARSQITRHDCVEGWSAIAKWTGVPLKTVLDTAGVRDNARFIVFFCTDKMFATPYYESIDLTDAYHPQTILAYEMNDADLPVKHGAPIRLRVERHLGYKHAKFVSRIEAVDTLAGIVLGGGGLWEDAAGYNWYAGI